MVMVPQNSRARICTGIRRSSSVYQIQILPRFLTTPASAMGCTRMVGKVPARVTTCSRASAFMVTSTTRMASATGMWSFPRLQRLRSAVEHGRHQVGHAGWDRRFLRLAGSAHQILLVQHLLAIVRRNFRVLTTCRRPSCSCLAKLVEQPVVRLKYDSKRSFTRKSRFTAPIDSPVATMCCKAPACSRWMVAMPAGKTRQSTA